MISGTEQLSGFSHLLRICISNLIKRKFHPNQINLMKISKIISLMLCIFVLSCTTNDQEEVVTPQPLEPTITDKPFITEEESKLLDKFFLELRENPDYYDKSTEEQIEFLTKFLNRSGYNVDAKDYSQYVYYDNWSKKKSEPAMRIDDYISRNGFNRNLIPEIDKLKHDIIASAPLMEKNEVDRVEYNAAFWGYLSTKESFMSLYQNQLASENAKLNWKCTLYGLKFGANFILCVAGLVKGVGAWKCALLPLDVLSVAEACAREERKDPCAGSSNPCCGVNCIQGYKCVNGSCVKDLGSDPCRNCGPTEQCLNGICQPL